MFEVFEGLEPALGEVPEVAPPGDLEEWAGVPPSEPVPPVGPPVAVGGASEYWIPLESA
jgi:hypothetical protein